MTRNQTNHSNQYHTNHANDRTNNLKFCEIP